MMVDSKVLDGAIIKDLGNHIYEKRKATAFQIESLVKSALAKNDSNTIFNIIKELADLAQEGTNTARMGSITALGSVSVALGSFAIAYFLDDIIRPILAMFRDIDARVRYYACESLYNVAKIAGGEILLYFNEVFDILCILITDAEASVKNAADILDRLIKDIISAKSTNYVSIIQNQEPSRELSGHFVDDDGVGVQVNNPQDEKKAFSLPKFIPTLLERMYAIDAFAKKFLLSWIELFDDIPSLELITFLPSFLEQLIRFLMHNAPSDVKTETNNLLNTFLREIRMIYKVKFHVKRKQFLEEQEKARLGRSNDQQDAKVPQTKRGNGPHADNDDAVSVESSSTTIIRKNESFDSQEVQEDDLSDVDGEIVETGQGIYMDFPRMINILLSFLRIGEPQKDLNRIELSDESPEVALEIQLIVLKWLQEILEVSPTSFVKYLLDCITMIVRNIAITEDNRNSSFRLQLTRFSNALQSFLINLNECASLADNDTLPEKKRKEIDSYILRALSKDICDEFIEFHLANTLSKLVSEVITSKDELSIITALDWLMFLHSNYPEHFFKGKGGETIDFTKLLSNSKDSSNDVTLRKLQLLSRISEENDVFFKTFMQEIIIFCRHDAKDKSHETDGRNKVEFVIRKLCMTLSPEKVYRAFSETLIGLEDLSFVETMVNTLSSILLTSRESADLRKVLKGFDFRKQEDWNLFSSLFECWSYDIASLLALCLLTSNYELAYSIITKLSDLEVSFELLVQLDILVQLLESPIFLKLRLQLLEPENSPYLYMSLYGLLMMLPQSSTFHVLKDRLSSVSHLSTASSQLSSMKLDESIASQPSSLKEKLRDMLMLFTQAQNAKQKYETNQQSNQGYIRDIKKSINE